MSYKIKEFYMCSMYIYAERINIFFGSIMNMIPNGTIVNNFAPRQLIPFENLPEEDRRSLPLEEFDERQLIIGSPVMICQTVPGYENPFWEVSDNNRIDNPVNNQTITNGTNGEIATFTVIPLSRHVVVLTIDLLETLNFPNELTGTYACRTPDSSVSSSVTLTNSELYLS